MMIEWKICLQERFWATTWWSAALAVAAWGVVYEAEDQKLGRSVAIKLLPDTTLEDPAALDRFWREARTASSLNHPAICTIHELNESGEHPFIVMELLEGQSLEKLYLHRSMPYLKLLDFGAQVADGLDAAHRKGVLHRDIKPSNLFLSPGGQAKILDFGLAKIEDGYAAANAVVSGTAETQVAPYQQNLGDQSRRHARHRGLHVSRTSTRRAARCTERRPFRWAWFSTSLPPGDIRLWVRLQRLRLIAFSMWHRWRRSRRTRNCRWSSRRSSTRS